MAETIPEVPIPPAGTSLDFADLSAVMPGDEVYFAEGADTVSAINTMFATRTSLATALAASFTSLGELAEAPAKVDSSVEKLRTRNYCIPGRRESSIELVVAGISDKTKAYFESSAFAAKDISIILLNRDRTDAVIFIGMRFKADWKAESDKVPQVTLTANFTGNSDKIRIYKITA
ncbi:MAG: hypothetical protein PHC50_03345 [Candidatus Cloacimonetes bacterium]|nr:hypothetical protein [Candidatus Cloacimonadota bacterium]